MRGRVKQDSFSALARELKSEQDARRLERQANRLLSRNGFSRDGRPRTEQRASVRPVYHHNGG